MITYSSCMTMSVHDSNITGGWWIVCKNNTVYRLGC